MSLDAQSLMSSVRLIYPDAECEIVEGRNNRFIIRIDKPPNFYVIEYDGLADVGLSNVRTDAESWLAGHEVVLEGATGDNVIRSLSELVNQSE